MFKVWLRPNVLVFLPLGFVSGLPLLLTSSTLGIWLADVGIDKTTISLFALVGIPYALKFFWAPFVDQVRIFYLARKLGQRRSWIILCQIILIILICYMASLNILEKPLLVAIVAFLIAMTSATHDIAIDALRIEMHKEEELGVGAAVYVFGYRIALLVVGAGCLIIADFFSWRMAYLFIASLVFVGVISVLLFSVKDAVIHKKQRNIEVWIKDAIILPFYDFRNRNNWLLILCFIGVFKWGDALLGVLSQPFMLEIGFSKTEIASVAKVYGLCATLLGLAIGGSLIARYGIYISLWISGILQLFSNFIFVYQAHVGDNIKVLTLTIGLENLSGGMGTAAFIAYLSMLCNIKYSAFQYALLTSFMAFSRTWLSTPSGWIVDNIDWNSFFNYIGFNNISAHQDWMGFFIFTGLMGIPGLIMLAFIHKNKLR